MKQMFVIIARGGSYEDAWERVEFVTDNETKGEAFIESRNKFSEEIVAALAQVEQAMRHWREVNPCPPQYSYVELPVPKFDGIKNITKEMRKERDDIRALNNIAYVNSMSPIHDWYHKQSDARQMYIDATFSHEIATGITHGYNDTTWSIEPVAWLE